MAEKLVHTGYGDGRSDFPIRLYVTYSSTQSTADNESTITVGMYVTTPGSNWTIGPWTDYGPTYIGKTDMTFNGAIPNFGGSRTLVSGKTFKVKHNNDGSGTARIYWAWGVNSSWGGFVKPSGYFDIDLPKIPRYFSSTPTFEVKSKTETSVTIRWTTPETAARVQYRIGANGSWVDVETDVNAKSGEFTIDSGLNYNTNYTIYGDFTRRDSSLWCQTKPSVNVTTYDIPFCNSRPDFTLGQDVTLGFYNPLGRKLTFSIVGPDGSVTTDSDWSITGTSYTGVSASTSIDKLYKSIPNATWGYYRVKTDWNGYSWTSPNGQNKFYINETINKPTFNDSNIINIKDSLLVDSITGNENKIIKGHNSITGSITAMTTKNYSTGNKYIINSNATPSYQEIAYNGGATNNFAFNNLESNSFIVTAYDSRGYYTAITKNVDMIDYSKPVVNLFTITRENGLGNYAILSANGSYTNWSGLKEDNSIIKVWFRYKKSTDLSYNNWNDVLSSQVIFENGQWAISVLLNTSFDTIDKYDFQFCVQDLLEESTVVNGVLSTANAFLWRDLENKRLGVNKKPNYTVDVNGDIHADGTITSPTVESDNVNANNIDSDTINSASITSNDVNSSNINVSYMMKIKGLNVNENNGRISSLDFKVDNESNKWSTIRNDLLSSSVTDMSDKPGEGFIETRFWDASGRWDTQMFIPNNSSYDPHIRYRDNNANWGNWERFIMEDSSSLVHDTGYNSNGRWIRFKNGYMICSNIVAGVPIKLTNSLSGKGTIWYGYNDNWTQFPQTFAENPTTVMNIATGANVFCIQPYPTNHTDRPPGFYPMGVDQGLEGTISVNYIACGRWK